MVIGNIAAATPALISAYNQSSAQPGSWGGLKDFSFTEKIGDFLGYGRTAQGGSNINTSSGQPTAQMVSGGQTQQIYGPGIGWAGTNDVVKPTANGATQPQSQKLSGTEQYTLPGWGQGQFNGQEVGSGGGIWSWDANKKAWNRVRDEAQSGGSSTPLTNQQLDEVINIGGVNKTRRSALQENLIDQFGNTVQQPVYTGPSDEELNQAYQPLMDILSKAEGQLGTSYESQQKNIADQTATAKQLADEQKRIAGETIAQNDLLGAKRKEDVISAARRLFQELQNANQQRFGGASSAGQAASELQGREFMGLSGKAQQGYADLTKELNAKSLEVNNNYALAIQQLEDKKNAALSEAQNQFQNSLLQINQQRAGLESEKMQRRLSALENYKNQVNAVQQQQNQFAQQLQMMKAQADIQMDQYRQQLEMSQQGSKASLQDYISNPQLSAVLSPQTQNQVASTYKGGFNQVDPALLAQLQGMTAGTTKRDELYPGLTNLQSMVR